MRLLTDHKTTGLNDAITIRASGEPGAGGANHTYVITAARGQDESLVFPAIEFQNGPISSPADFNGVTNEALLAILIDRMRGFQHARNPDGSFDFNSRGKYASRENALALTAMEEALLWLQKRTRDRMARGVEGTHKV